MRQQQPRLDLSMAEVKLALACITNHMTGLKLSELSEERQKRVGRLGHKLMRWLDKVQP